MSMGRQRSASSRNVWMCAVAALLPALFSASAAIAQTAPVIDEAKSLSTVVDPVERSFDIGQAGAGKYRITLTDLGALLPTPAALSSVKLVLTRGQTVVVQLDGDKKDATNVNPPVDTVDFDATPGTYIVHVVGAPGPVNGSGPVGVKIATVATPATSVVDFSGTLAAPATTRTDLRTYQLDLDVPADGAYEMTLADLQFPRAGELDTASVFLFPPGGSQLTACLNVPAVGPCPTTQTVTLTAGRYQLVVGGGLGTGKEAAVFSVQIKSVATGAVLHSRAVELGTVKRISDSAFQLNTGSYTLSLKDLAFPAALTEASAIVTRAAQVTALANATTPDAVFTVAADATAYDVFAYAKADNTSGAAGAGSFDVEVKPASGASALSFIAAMGDPSGSPTAYTFPVDITAAGTYRVKFGDFQFPVSLGASRIAVVQNGALVGKTDPGTGSTLSLDASLVIGRATVVVIVKPALTGGSLSQTGGTFGLEMALASGGQNVLDETQGVGGLVSVRKVSIATAGKYDLLASDLDAPEAFSDLMAVISRGSQRLGTVVVGSGGANPQGGSARLNDLDLSAGNYAITLIAQPGTTVHAATYGLLMTASPPAPTVTLTPSATSVTSGSTISLSWSSSSGATSCTASSNPSGVWSGTKNTAGTDSSIGPLTVATTFTLKCTDANTRTGEKSVTVNITAQNNGGSGKGGGGAFDWLTLAVLAFGGAAQFGSRLRRRPAAQMTDL